MLSSIKIGSRVWTLGESISSIGTTAVCKSKLRDSFGDAWAEASVTGIVLGKGAKKKIRVRWTNLKDAEDMEYGYNHKIFANPLSPLCMKGRKSVLVSRIAPLAAGAGATVSKSADDMLLAVPSASRDQRARNARSEEPSLDDQSDILSASKSAEVSGMKRKRAHDEVEQDENPRRGGARKERPKCSHGKQKSCCKECGGSGICSHGKDKRFCKECGGSGICGHGKRKAQCKECGGSAICGHGKRKAQCKECGGSAICGHGKQKAHCKECRPPASTPAAPEGSEVPAQAAAGEAGAGSEAAGTGSAE